MKGLSLDQHKTISLELQNYHDTCQKIALIITRAIPKKHFLFRVACKFDGGPGSPLFDLRNLLNSMVCKEYPSVQDIRKMYFYTSHPDYHPPELLPGLPEQTAKKFTASIKKKTKSLWGRKKQRLTSFELACIIHSLHHTGNRIAVIGIGLMEAYHPDQTPADSVLTVLAELRNLLFLLQQELETSLEAQK